MEIENLYYTLGLDDSQLNSALTRSSERFDNFMHKVARTGAGIGAIMKFSQLGSDVLNFTKDFDSKMREVWTLTDLSKEKFEELKKSIIDLSSESKSGISSEELAEAQYQYISATGDVDNSIKALSKTIKIAKAGAADLFTSIDGITTITNAWKISFEDMDKTSDLLFTTVKEGKTTIQELASSIGQVAPLASQANIPLEEILATVATLTKQGLSTSEAMTSVKAILTNIIGPSNQALQISKELGIQFNLTGMQAKGFSGFLEDTYQKIEGNSEVMSKLFGSVEALNGVMGVTGKNAAEQIKVMEKLEKSAGSTQEAYEKMEDSLEQVIKVTEEQIKNIFIKLGEALTPLIKLFNQLTQGFVGWVDNMSFEEKIIISVTGSITALIVTLKTLNNVINVLKISSGNWTSIIMGVVSAVAGITAIFGTFNHVLKDTKKITEDTAESMENININIDTTKVMNITNDFEKLKKAVNEYNYAVKTGYGDLNSVQEKIDEIIYAHPEWKNMLDEVNGGYYSINTELEKTIEKEIEVLKLKRNELIAEKENIDHQKNIIENQKDDYTAYINPYIENYKNKLKELKDYAKLTGQETGEELADNLLNKFNNLLSGKIVNITQNEFREVLNNMKFNDADSLLNYFLKISQSNSDFQNNVGKIFESMNELNSKIIPFEEDSKKINEAIESANESITEAENKLKMTEEKNSYENEYNQIQDRIKDLENTRNKLLEKFSDADDETKRTIQKEIELNGKLLEEYYSNMSEVLENQAKYFNIKGNYEAVEEKMKKALEYEDKRNSIKTPEIEYTEKFDTEAFKEEFKEKMNLIYKAVGAGYSELAQKYYSDLKNKLISAQEEALNDSEFKKYIDSQNPVVEKIQEDIDSLKEVSQQTDTVDYEKIKEFYDELLKSLKFDYNGGTDKNDLLNNIFDFSEDDLKKMSDNLREELFSSLNQIKSYQEDLKKLHNQEDYFKTEDIKDEEWEKFYNNKLRILTSLKETYMQLDNSLLGIEDKKQLLKDVDTQITELEDKINSFKKDTEATPDENEGNKELWQLPTEERIAKYKELLKTASDFEKEYMLQELSDYYKTEAEKFKYSENTYKMLMDESEKYYSELRKLQKTEIIDDPASLSNRIGSYQENMKVISDIKKAYDNALNIKDKDIASKFLDMAISESQEQYKTILQKDMDFFDRLIAQKLKTMIDGFKKQKEELNKTYDTLPEDLKNKINEIESVDFNGSSLEKEKELIENIVKNLEKLKETYKGNEVAVEAISEQLDLYNSKLNETKDKIKLVQTQQEALTSLSESALKSLTGFLDDMGGEYKKLAGIINAVPNLLKSIEAALASGGIIGWIILAIDLTAKIFQNILNSKNEIKEIDEKNLQISEQQIEAEEKLIKLKEKLYGQSKLKSLYNEYKESIDNLQEIEELQKKLDEELNKSHTESKGFLWWKKTVTIDDTDMTKVNDIISKIEELQDDMKEIIFDIGDALGFGIDTLTNDVSTALYDAIANNYSYEEFINNFAESMKDRLRKAIIESMATKVLEPYINAITASVATAFGNDGQFSEEEITGILSLIKQFTNASGELIPELQKLFESAGLQIGSSSGNYSGKSDVVKNITEETGNRLAELWETSVIYLSQIDKNTLRTADNTDILTKGIIKVDVQSFSGSAKDFIGTFGE